jgi:CHC2 zinc finger
MVGSGPSKLSQRCHACGFPIRQPSDSEFSCSYCLAGCPIFNDFIRCPLEAHLAWICFSLLRWGEIRPFPGDRLTRPPVVAVGRAGAGDIFGRLRQVDLAEYASRYTELRPVGPGRWKGLCPLHREKTASFYIYADPWRWQCYGACSTGGDIVALVRELKLKEGKWQRATTR